MKNNIKQVKCIWCWEYTKNIINNDWEILCDICIQDVPEDMWETLERNDFLYNNN